MRRLTRAAAHSDAQLITEAAALADGWVVLVDLMGDVICSTLAPLDPRGARRRAPPAPSPPHYPQDH